MYPLKSVGKKPPSYPATFEQERPQMPERKTVLTIHWPKNDVLVFLKFLQKKVCWLDKKTPALFCIVLGVVTFKSHVAKPIDSFNKCRKIIFLCRETFFCRILKNARMSFLGQCNVETASYPGLQGLSCSKVAGFEGVLIIKFSRATFLVFMSTQMMDIYLSYLPMKQIW